MFSTFFRSVVEVLFDQGLPFTGFNIFNNDTLFNVNNEHDNDTFPTSPFDSSLGDQQPRIRNADTTFITAVVKWHRHHSFKLPHDNFLLLYVKEQGSGRKSVIFVKRKGAHCSTLGVDDGNVDAQCNHKPRKGTGATSEATSMPGSHAKTSVNFDTLTFSQVRSDRLFRSFQVDHEVVASLEITGDHFSVAQFAVLANLVDNHPPENTRFQYHPLFFAEAIYSVVKGICPGVTQHKGSHYSRDGKPNHDIVDGIEESWIADVTSAFKEVHWPLFQANLEGARARERDRQAILAEAEAIIAQEELARQRAEEATRQAEEKSNANEMARREAEMRRRMAEDRVLIAKAEKRKAEEELTRLRHLKDAPAIAVPA